MMLTTKAAAERVGVSTSLVYQLCKDGLLPCFRIGGKDKRGKVLIDEKDLEAFVRKCRSERIASAVSLIHITP